MAEQKPLILQIQEDCLNNRTPVSEILRKAKVAAIKLDLDDFLEWINDELEGYKCDADELPLYRILTGTPKAFNPYHGWQPIIFRNSDMARGLSTAPINQAIGPMEDTMSNRSKGEILVFPYSPETRTKLISSLEFPTDVHLEIPDGSMNDIIDKVRNILLNWTLELEKSGILGERMSFKKEDKAEAGTVTQNFYADNIAVTGQVRDQASVTNIQSSYRLPLDIKAVLDFTDQTKNSISQLPEKMQGSVREYTDQIVEETSKIEPDHSRIRSLLTSIKTVCEAATGNLTAHGIVSMIGNLFP
jgi:hypothetical protein